MLEGDARDVVAPKSIASKAVGGCRVRANVSASPVSQGTIKREWAPDAGTFHRLLVWLDEGVDSDGRRYVDMRRRLVAYFQRRGATAPDEAADETLNRVARRLDEAGAIDDGPPARYCYITAKFVLLET